MSSLLRAMMWLVLAGGLLAIAMACGSEETPSASDAASPGTTAPLPTPTASPRPSPTPTPSPTPSPTPTPLEILRQAESVMRVQKSFHMELTYQGKRGTPILPGMELVTASGDISGVGLQVRVGILLPEINAYVEQSIVSDGEKTFMSDPLSGRWSDVSQAQLPCILSDFEQRIADLLGRAEEVALVGEEQLEGRSVYHLRASFLAEAVADVVCSLGAGAPVKADVWVDRERRLVFRLRLEGRIGLEEPEGLVRTLTLSRFGQNVTIEMPSL